MTPAIEVHELTKQYAGATVVRDVSFTVEHGEIFGIIGPNGAGKTTTVECIEGLRRPDGGHTAPPQPRHPARRGGPGYDRRLAGPLASAVPADPGRLRGGVRGGGGQIVPLGIKRMMIAMRTAGP
jgi:energy-coupling factor transporter ATP-binding protein EcfA2